MGGLVKEGWSSFYIVLFRLNLHNEGAKQNSPREAHLAVWAGELDDDEPPFVPRIIGADDVIEEVLEDHGLELHRLNLYNPQREDEAAIAEIAERLGRDREDTVRRIFLVRGGH